MKRDSSEMGLIKIYEFRKKNFISENRGKRVDQMEGERGDEVWN